MSVEKKDTSNEEKNERRLLAAGILSSIFLSIVVGIIIYLISIGIRMTHLPEVMLPLIVIAGVTSMLASLVTAAVVLSALKLADPKQALALPEGSVRALIALSLILIFAITAIYLFRKIGPYYVNIPINNTYVTKEIVPTPDQIQFGLQILTTVATLVVAVAGFYFGTRAVQVARGAAEVPTLTVLTPISPTTLDTTPGKELIIKLQTTPEDEAIQWDKPEGDDDGTLVQEKPNQFKYTRGSKVQPGNLVTLNFKLAKYPDVTAKLLVVAP